MQNRVFEGKRWRSVTDSFPTSNNYLNDLWSQIGDDVLSDIMEHLRCLQVTVKEYFPPVVGYQWLRKPFMFFLT
jgi:hypothetical protein